MPAKNYSAFYRLSQTRLVPTLAHESTLENVYQHQFSGISLVDSLVHTSGSDGTVVALVVVGEEAPNHRTNCLLYTSDAADE